MKTKDIRKFLACVTIGLACSSISMAQKAVMEQYAQEFFIGETVFPQERNELQFTLKPRFTKSEYNHLLVPLSIEYGFTDRLQVEIETPYLISTVANQSTIHGLGQTTVGLLYNIVKSNRPFSLSIGVEKSLETSGHEIKEYNDETSWEAIIVGARQFGKFQIHSNISSEFTKEETVLNYGISSIFNFGRWNATLELDAEKEEQRVFGIAPGIIWKSPGGFELGLAFSKSINSAYASWGFVSMLTYEFSLAGD